MKKIFAIIGLVLLVLSCSQNFEKKKNPPAPPKQYKEAKPIDKNED
ncbi:MAG: hypothetical protein N2445_07915 [Acidobacteria bacterium]|nr:hypothetical protein [Acidobacteriota bacterium]